MGSANERQHYIVKLSLIDWTHIQNDPCIGNCSAIDLRKKNNWWRSLFFIQEQHMILQDFGYELMSYLSL